RSMDFSRTVLVTGGAGFIGSHLVCSLVHRHPEWRIINLDNFLNQSYLTSLHVINNTLSIVVCTVIHMDSCLQQGDVCNSRLVNHIFNSENIDIIFHLAARTHVEASFESPSAFQRVNVDGTRVLLGAAHQARHQPQRFIYISTDEVYGPSLDEVFDESSPVRPSNPYAATKAAAEYLVRSYWDQYKFPIIITRSNNIYGPRQYTEKVHKRSIYATINMFLSLCSTIQGTLPKSRHFLFVSDAINAFLLVLEKGIVGEIYNVGTSCEIPIVQLARELVRMVGLGAVYSNIKQESFRKLADEQVRLNKH
uniref:NAD-dependent epimerase/dehydratase domain-containing protein n=1 Tax=Amphilophus citrinellus TaxID=61819 RepID=A0A3Q0S2R1_AMPCI